MDTINTCSCCQQPLPPDAPGGLCPQCLMQAGLGTGVDAGPNTQSGTHPSFTAPTPAELAQFFPQLEILKLLGRGGMGAVYKARQTQLDRLVAVKILPPGIGDDPAFAERFTREAKALAKLNHPNIVTLYEFGQTDGLFFFIMEFVDGLNLRQLLEAGRIAPREALAIVPQICDALQYAHDASIVHRDIKPENILLDRQGRVKVADFGLAKIIHRATADDLSDPSDMSDPSDAQPHRSVTTTAAGKVMGTPQYMAPEQTEHPSEVDHRADIYSLGVVFYQMLTGELPVGQPLAPPSRKVLLDVRLDEVVLRALEKEPERRYQQASILKTRVETILTTPQKAGTRGDWRTRVAVVGVRDGRRVINWPAVVLDAVIMTAISALPPLLEPAKYQPLPLLLVWLVLLSTIPVGIYLGLTRQPIGRLLCLDEPPAAASAPPRGAASRQIQAAAIGLLVTASLRFLYAAVCYYIFNIWFERVPLAKPDTFMVPRDLPGVALFLILTGLSLFGALKMKRQASYGWGIAAAFLAILPSISAFVSLLHTFHYAPAFAVIWPGYVVPGLSLVAGVWALIVLGRSEVRVVFPMNLAARGHARPGEAARKSEAGEQSPDGGASGTAANWRVIVGTCNGQRMINWHGVVVVFLLVFGYVLAGEMVWGLLITSEWTRANVPFFLAWAMAAAGLLLLSVIHRGFRVPFHALVPLDRTAQRAIATTSSSQDTRSRLSRLRIGLVATVAMLALCATGFISWAQRPRPQGASVCRESSDGRYLASVGTWHAMHIFGRDRFIYRFEVEAWDRSVFKIWEIPVPFDKLTNNSLDRAYADFTFEKHGHIEWLADSSAVKFFVRDIEVAGYDVPELKVSTGPSTSGSETGRTPLQVDKTSDAEVLAVGAMLRGMKEQGDSVGVTYYDAERDETGNPWVLTLWRDQLGAERIGAAGLDMRLGDKPEEFATSIGLGVAYVERTGRMVPLNGTLLFVLGSAPPNKGARASAYQREFVRRASQLEPRELLRCMETARKRLDPSLQVRSGDIIGLLTNDGALWFAQVGEVAVKSMALLTQPAGRMPLDIYRQTVQSFATVVESIIPDWDFGRSGERYIDLDAGRMLAVPPDLRKDELGRTRQWYQWQRRNGVDLEVVVKGESCYGSGMDAAGVQVDNNQWDMLSPERLATMATNEALSRPRSRNFIFTLTDFPVTYAVKTREGGLGIIQFTGFTDNPRGVKIRYKLVQQTEDQALRALLDAGPVPAGMVRSRVLCKEMLHLLAEVFDAGQKPGETLPAEEKNSEFLGQSVRDLQARDPNLLLVTPGQEKHFAAGSFDDAQNTKMFGQTLKILKDFGKPLPSLYRYLIDQFQAGKLSGARLEAARRIMAVQVAQIIKEISGAGLANALEPVLERVLNDLDEGHGNEALHLQTGTLSSVPADAQKDRKVLDAWLKTNRMDLLADFARNRWALFNIGLTLADFPAARWDEATPADLTPALASGTTLERLDRSGQVFFLLPEQPQWPVTFAFKTHEGDQGLLQISGATDNPRGLKIRYKTMIPQPGQQRSEHE